MTLQAALAAGRKVRLGTTGTYKTKAELTSTLNQYNVDQLMSDDWGVEPAAVTMSKDAFAAHWDAVAASFSNVKGSSSSPLFAALVTRIYG